MKLKMAQNSLFAILLRKPWWISVAIGAALAALALALLSKDYRVVGAALSLPFFVIAILAARRQWRTPGAARVAETVEATGAMTWPAFSGLLEQAFRRELYEVHRRVGKGSGGVDFELLRDGRRTLVCARRWKSAHIGHAPLRALHAEREACEAGDALFICLGELSDSARAFADEHRVTVWQAVELAGALKGLPLPAVRAR